MTKPAETVWAKVVNSTELVEIKNFYEAFSGTAEGFLAQRRYSQLAEDKNS